MSSLKKYLSGNDKRKKKQKIEEFIRSQAGALDKFFLRSKQTETSNSVEDILNDDHKDMIENEEYEDLVNEEELNQRANENDNENLNESELAWRLEKTETIDKSMQEQIEKEKEHWKHVLIRIITVVKTLAKRNLAFWGDNENTFEENNEFFLSIIQMIAEFDPVMQEHLRRIKHNQIHSHYLSHEIQTDLIRMMANEIKSAIVERIKKAKYFSVILDCTTDKSGEEQMSLVIRCVDISASLVQVKEFFLGFLKVDVTSGQGLFNELVEVLKALQLDVGDMRGQGYDNFPDMNEKYKCVQKRVLEINPRAFCMPCGCHSLNIALCDMAGTCTEVAHFFGGIRCIYVLFSSSPKRWQVFNDHVDGLSLEPLSETRWESCLESVKVMRFQVSQIRDALLHLVNTDDVYRVKHEAESLVTYELENFEFLVALVILYKLLFAINSVSNTLQVENMNIDIAIHQLRGLITFLKKYRENGFVEAITEAKELAIAMEIEPVFCERHIIHRKKQFEDNVIEKVTQSVEEYFRVNFFLYVVDQGISLLEQRFEQFQIYEYNFGFLFNLETFKSVDNECLKTYCANLEEFLKSDGYCDIDGRDLFTELEFLKENLPKEIKRPIEVLNHLKQMDGCFPNAWIAYRILLTIPVTVASEERSFSKLKLIKSYLRSTMSQEMLNELAMLSIENDMVDKIEYATLISDFASKIARRVMFQ